MKHSSLLSLGRRRRNSPALLDRGDERSRHVWRRHRPKSTPQPVNPLVNEKKPPRHMNTSQSTSLDETMTSTRSLFSGLETRTSTQSFAYMDGDTLTTVYEEEATLGDDVSLGSNTFNDTTFTDENTSISYYSFRMADTQGPKKYQYGVGTPPRFGSLATTQQARNLSKASSEISISSVSRESFDHTITDGLPPSSCLSTVVDEMKGSYKDISKTINQVLYAFSISADDLDLVSAKIRDARLEVMGMKVRKKRIDNTRTRTMMWL